MLGVGTYWGGMDNGPPQTSPDGDKGLAVPVGMTSKGKGRSYVPGGRVLAVSGTKTMFTDEITHVMRMDWFSRSGGMRRNMRF